jgi:hypothetical protein
MRIQVSALIFLLLSCWCCSAQQIASPNPSDTSSSSTSPNMSSTPDERRVQLDYLQQAREALKKYLSSPSSNSEDNRMAQRTIQDLDAKLENLIKLLDKGASSTLANMPVVNTGSSPQSHPEFSLAVPRKGRTNISTETTLTWTEDRRNGAFQDPPLYNLKGFHVVIARDASFRQIVTNEPSVTPASAKVTPSTLAPKGLQSIATSFTIPADRLEPGTKYYWRVFAVYTPPGQPDTVEFEQEGAPQGRGANYFITTIDPFHPLTTRNFSLQRTVDSTDPTEGAQFSFLKTFGGKAVYSADFAFFWDSTSKRFAKDRGFVWFRPAVEGKLTSDKAKSEDAWRFSGSAVVDYNFIDLEGDEHNRIRTGTSVSAPRKFIDGLYFELGGMLESDQGFDTKKLASRLYFSPSSRLLAIGTATGHPESPVQFVWRPSFEFNAGRTFETGDSAETGKTILRMVPKVRMTLYTRALSRLLKVANSSFFVDNTFYYLPNDQLKKKHNFFTSGFELLFMKNFGFGLTYKNGESAPRFKRVNSFGGVLTVRFGPE